MYNILDWRRAGGLSRGVRRLAGRQGVNCGLVQFLPYNPNLKAPAKSDWLIAALPHLGQMICIRMWVPAVVRR
jgi:hypothetical protein